MATKIKPCPFCGCRDIIHIQECGVIGLFPGHPKKELWYCWCDRCGVQTRKTLAKAKATSLWNRRSP